MSTDTIVAAAMSAAGATLSLLLLVLGWSLRRNLQALETQGARTEQKLDALAGAQAQTREELSVSQSNLRALSGRVDELGRRVSGIEEREHSRGCYGSCPPRTLALRQAQDGG